MCRSLHLESPGGTGGRGIVRLNKRLISVIGTVCLTAAIVGSGSAFGATPNHPETTAAWQQRQTNQPALPAGCYQASYPSSAWRATTCQTAPNIAFRPKIVGDGKDYSAVVSGKISKAIGSFNGTGKITESGKYGNTGSKIANTYSLQLNSQFFSGSPACSGSSNPSQCQAWEQFVYDSHNEAVFMQYWLINYKATCPSGWFTLSPDCYKNSPTTKFAGGRIPAAGLTTTKLTASAVAGGKDEIQLSYAGKATLVSNSDNVLGLANSWNTAEYNVLGDGSGGEAFFGAKTTLESQTTLTVNNAGAPSCVKEGFTAETNNLNFTHTAALGSEPSPTVAFEQTNAAASGASCATAP